MAEPTPSDSPVHDISEDECRKLLALFEFGRIAFLADGVLEVFPVNYHAAGSAITFRTAPATRLASALLAADVVFEIDHIGVKEAWSVVGRGRARRLEDEREVEAAAALPIRPLIPTNTREFVRIDLARISGRRFHRWPTGATARATPDTSG